ncbi:MAG: triose-phosphate isomerase [Ignavibacteria bacterium]
MRKKLIAGNWKMNKSYNESQILAEEIVKSIEPTVLENIDVLICPPFISLGKISDVIKDSGIKLGAQNVYSENDGAYTGEISAEMLKSVGCEYVIIGHSERRKFFNETDEVVNAKVKKALDKCLKVIVCVGETLEERESADFEKVVTAQVTGSLKDISKENMQDVVIAYEPVWAIGTGLNATPEQASEIHGMIGKTVTNLYDKDTAENLRILYGGSVNATNAKEMLSACGVDGALIGGASLKPDDFISIANEASKIK